jgi:hypothetical protein
VYSRCWCRDGISMKLGSYKILAGMGVVMMGTSQGVLLQRRHSFSRIP